MGDSPTIRYRVLGETSLVIDGRIASLPGQRQRAVLGYLILKESRPVSFDNLIDALWGERPPKTARNSVQRFVADIRRVLGRYADRLETVPDGYRLVATPDEVDLAQAQSAITAGRAAALAGDPGAASTELHRATELWSGQALGGVGNANFAAGESIRLEELRLGAIEDAIDADLALGLHREIADTVERFAYEHPTRERAWSLLMLTRYRCERQTDAVAAYRELQEHLSRDLRLEPSPAVEELYLQILDQVPELDAPSGIVIPGGAVATSPSSPLPVDVTRALPLPLPLPHRLLRSSTFPLSGRADEVEALLKASESVVVNGPSVILVEGEAGIGKTRLVSEVAARLHGEGWPVLYGSCDEDLAAPYQPWVDAFELITKHAPAFVAAQHRDAVGDVLSVLIPSSGLGNGNGNSDGDGHATSKLPSSADPHPGGFDEGGSRQSLVFRGAVQLLEAVAAERPMLLILDDLQWADGSTLKLLLYVARHAANPLLVVGSYRGTEVNDAHPLTDLIGLLTARAKTKVIRLEGLSEQAANELTGSAVGSEFDGRVREIAAAICQETNGNPFFFTEILNSLIESGAIETAEADGRFDGSLPESIQRVVHQRTARIGDAAGRTLRAASVFGREFELDLLAAALGRDELDALDHVEAAIHAGLVIDAPGGRDRFLFTHDLVHHSLYRELSQSRRSRFHIRIADAIESKLDNKGRDRSAELANHLVTGADPNQIDRTLGACRNAGTQASEKHAPEEASLWFEQAINQLEQRANPDEALRAALLVQLGTQQRNAGNLDDCSTLTEAGQLALELGEVETLVDAVLANSRSLNARTWDIDEDRIALLRAALDLLGPVDTADRAALLATLANEQWDAEHRQDAKALYRESIALARRLEDPSTLAISLIRVSRARNLRLEREELQAVSEEIQTLCASGEITDPLIVVNGLATALNTALQLGRAGEAAAAMQAIWDAEEKVQLPMYAMPAHLARCLTAGLRGDIAEYERLAGLTFGVGGDIDQDEAMFIFEGHLFYTRYLQGRMGELLDALENIMQERPEVSLYRAIAALLHTEEKQFEKARALLDAEMSRGFEPAIDMFSVQSLTLWAEAAASAGHLEGCKLLHELLAPFSTEMAGHLVQVTEPTDLALGHMSTCLARYDEAAGHFRLAGEIADGFGGRWMRARADLGLARMLTARAASGDNANAKSLAQKVRAVATEEGYAVILRDADELLNELGAAPSA